MASTCCKIVRRSGLLIGLSLAMLSGNAQAQQVPFPTAAAQVPGPAPGTAMTKAYVEMGLGVSIVNEFAVPNFFCTSSVRKSAL